MSLSTAELEQLLSLALAALRANAGQPVQPVQPVAASAPSQAPAAAAPAAGLPTLGQWLDIHLEQLREKGYKAQTIKNRTSNIAHVRQLWGGRPIAAIKPHEIASALRKFDPKHSSKAGRVLAEVRDAYTEAIANGWADVNPAAAIKAPAHKVMRARLKWEVWQAMRGLAKTGPQKWVESLLLLALATGQRRGDLAKMRFSDIVTTDDGQQCLRIEQQKEAGKGYGARVEIPLSLYMACIEMTLGEVIEHCRTIGKPGPTLLRQAGGGAIEMPSLSARFHQCIVAVEGDGAYRQYEWPSLHEVRSLCGRTLIEEGLAPAQVQSLLGHKHAEMTAAYLDDRGLSAADWKVVAVPA